jgi:hypothetical protein
MSKINDDANLRTRCDEVRPGQIRYSESSEGPAPCSALVLRLAMYMSDPQGSLQSRIMLQVLVHVNPS